MNKYLCALIAAMWAILFAAGTWWVGRAEKKFEIVDELHYRDFYLHGNVPAAPVEKPEGTPPAAKK
jgi:cytochrome oxidase assembly protein ShyY1